MKKFVKFEFSIYGSEDIFFCDWIHLRWIDYKGAVECYQDSRQTIFLNEQKLHWL